MSLTPEAAATALSNAQYADSYPKGIGRDYWHFARSRILWSRLAPTLEPGSRVLDIGCGSGIVVQFLRERGVDCFGSDLGTPIPDEPASAPYLQLGQSAFELDRGFRESIDTVLLMDVLEHLPEPAQFLRQCRAAFPRLRTVHVTLPARMEIWSNYDEYYGHFRRYTAGMVGELAADSGYTLVDASYAFHGLYLAARLNKLLARERTTKLSAPRNTRAHALLGRLLELEHRLLPSGLKGSSIFALLRPA